jgi:HlyD family secretion protein
MSIVLEAVHRQAAGDASQSPANARASQPTGTSQPTKKPDRPISRFRQALAWSVVILALGAGGYYAWLTLRPPGLPEGLVSGNGRIEGTEIDVDAKIPGRISQILVGEGDFVSVGQALVHMDIKTLEAQRREAEAQLERAKIGVETAEAVVSQRQAERTAATAQVATRKAIWATAAARLARVEPMAEKGFETKQALDDARAGEQSTNSAIAEAQANLAAVEAALSAAKAGVVDAKAAVIAAQAAVDRIVADIDDSSLKTPRDGRVQYKVAEEGEVLPAGGRVVNLVDLGDVYMTFYLPTKQAGEVAIGAEARIVLDAFPEYVIPATITFVASVAQFTPKTVETEVERQKLMFRLKANIPPDLLRKYKDMIKTGVPGMAYVKLDTKVRWPDNLSVRLPQQ